MGLGRLGWLGGDAPGFHCPRPRATSTRGLGSYNRTDGDRQFDQRGYLQRWNQYLYLSNEEATRKYLAKKNDDIQKNKDSYNEIIKRLQDNPDRQGRRGRRRAQRRARPAQRPADSGSSLRIADTPIDAKIIAEIPVP